jgi:methionyl-tRNA synthetase
MPETKDNDFTWREFQLRHNSELVAILGNFIHRTVVLTHKYFSGKVPDAQTFLKEDLNVVQECKKSIEDMEQDIQVFHFRDAVQKMMQVARLGNKYLADMEPWKMTEEKQDRRKAVLFTSLQISAMLSVITEPFLPFTSQKIKQILACDHLTWPNLKNDFLLMSGHNISEPVLLFRKIEDAEISAQVEKLNKSKEITVANGTREEEKEAIVSYEEFAKMKFVVATIVHAEKVKGADKLLKLTLDDGKKQRTVVSGIAQHHQPEQIIGKQIMLLANLAPRKLRGIESDGMILMAESDSGKLIFVSPEEKINNGASVK